MNKTRNPYGWSNTAVLEYEELQDQFNTTRDPAMRKALVHKMQAIGYRERDRIAGLNRRGK